MHRKLFIIFFTSCQHIRYRVDIWMYNIIFYFVMLIFYACLLFRNFKASTECFKDICFVSTMEGCWELRDKEIFFSSTHTIVYRMPWQCTLIFWDLQDVFSVIDRNFQFFRIFLLNWDNWSNHQNGVKKTQPGPMFLR